MFELKGLKEQRVAKEKEFEALVNAAETRELTAEETAKLDTLETELKELDKQIKLLTDAQARRIEIAKRKSGAAAVGAPQDNASEQKEFAKFSFQRALQTIKKGGRNGIVDGLEKELFDEATKEYAEAGIGTDLRGNIRIPSRMVKFVNQEKRILTVATEGSDVVFTDYGGLIGSLVAEPLIDRLGVTILNGLRGNLKYPRSSNNLLLIWESEISDADELTPTFDAVDLTPHRAAGYIDVSMQMMLQSPFVMEQFIRNKIREAYEATLDTALLAGVGPLSPVGIINYPGVNIVSLGTNGGDMTYGALLQMVAEAAADNARDGNGAFVLNPKGIYALGRTPIQSGGTEGNMIFKPGEGTIIGEPYIVTNRMPSNLSKGTGTNLSATIYSPNWSSALVGLWGGLDILFDPYTQATKGTVRFVVNIFADVDVEHPEEFVVVKDWVTTVPAAT